MTDFVLKRDGTVYVLVDQPDFGRVYLEVDAKRPKSKIAFLATYGYKTVSDFQR